MHLLAFYGLSQTEMKDFLALSNTSTCEKSTLFGRAWPPHGVPLPIPPLGGRQIIDCSNAVLVPQFFFYLTWGRVPGRYSGFQVMEIIEWGQKLTPKKFPGPKLLSLKNFQKALNSSTRKIKFLKTCLVVLYSQNHAAGRGYTGTTTNLQIVLKYLQKICY